ncbi:MAG: cob(I)yrinic acid a,c-diamide adenosyltransferase [Planctomycetota bacterium]
MVRLTKIYTRTGDDGTTGLGDGSRRPKHHLRVAAYGTVDELSSTLGLVVAHGAEAATVERLRRIQNELFDVGADLSVPGEMGDKLRIQPAYTTRLEAWIDADNANLQPLSSFVLPGGEPTAAWLHVARTVCRRAERLVSELATCQDEALNPEVLRYLNRLSDLLFVMARVANDNGAKDVLWKPGDTRES